MVKQQKQVDSPWCKKVRDKGKGESKQAVGVAQSPEKVLICTAAKSRNVTGVDEGRESRYCSSVEGNLIMNKGELQYYDCSIAVSSTLLLALTHVPNLLVTPAWFVWRMYGVPYRVLRY